MAFDGIVTKAITYELKNLIGFKIDKVFEPDKNTIIFGLYGKGTNFNLLSCISSNNCRIHLTTHQFQNPFSAPNFCMSLRKHLIGMKIKDIYSKDLERVIFIDLENSDMFSKSIRKKLIIELMGKHSNIILADSNDIIINSMRHTFIEKNSNRDIYPTAKYYFPETQKRSFLSLNNFDEFYQLIEPDFTNYLLKNNQNISDLSISNFGLDKIISNTFNGISSSFIKNLINELNLEYLSKDALLEIYNKIIEIINLSNINIHLNTVTNDYYLYSDNNNLHDFKDFQINYFLDDYYFEKEQNDLFKNYKNTFLNYILSILKKYEKRLVNIDLKLSECKDMDKYKLYGELITANLYKMPNYNIKEIKLENYYDNNKEITINLNDRFSPSYNAKLFFKKYSKLKNAKAIVNIQKVETIDEINYLESVVYELNSCQTLDDITEIYDEISKNPIFSNLPAKGINTKLAKKSPKSKLLTKNKNAKFNPIKYIVDGYTILVGRNNVENDYLTCKFAKKNDIWFHTKDIPGSHVILKVELNEIVSDNIIYEAAKLAVKHSKAKNSSHTPVDYCTVSDVKKPHGSKPGFVIYKNNKTIYI